MCDGRRPKHDFIGILVVTELHVKAIKEPSQLWWNLKKHCHNCWWSQSSSHVGRTLLYSSTVIGFDSWWWQCYLFSMIIVSLHAFNFCCVNHLPRLKKGPSLQLFSITSIKASKEINLWFRLLMIDYIQFRHVVSYVY